MKSISRGFAAAALVLLGIGSSAVPTHAEDFRALADRNGGTLTSPTLRADANRTLVAYAVSVDKCDRPRIVREVITYPSSRFGNWTERWGLYNCGTFRVFDINFTHAADGGTNLHARLIGSKKVSGGAP